MNVFHTELPDKIIKKSSELPELIFKSGFRAFLIVLLSENKHADRMNVKQCYQTKKHFKK